MFELLLTSSAVSLLTLGILLLRRTEPELLQIPTSRYGGRVQKARSRLRVSRPPLLLWLLVLFATCAFAVSYFRDDSDSRPQGDQGRTALWIDTSLSSWWAAQRAESLDPVIQRLLEVNRSFIAIRPTIRWDADAEGWKTQIDFVDLNGKEDVAAYVETTFDPAHESHPSPFSQALSYPALVRSLESAQESVWKGGELVIVSDGQQASLSGISGLQSLFGRFRLIDLPVESLDLLPEAEILPKSLLTAWTQTGDSRDAPSDLPREVLTADPESWILRPWNRQDALTRAIDKIPRQARPSVSLVKVNTSAGHEFVLSSLSQLLAPDSGMRSSTPSEALFTHCSRQPSGPQELDVLADLQALARFFNVPLRTLDCRERNQTRQSASDPTDPWFFRRSSLWLVPLSQPVLNTLTFQRQLWLPEGYRPESDALIYFASSSQTLSSMVDPTVATVREIVQLEPESAPAPLFLAPQPPQTPISEPFPLGEPSRGSSRESTGRSFQPLVQAADGKNLIFKLETNDQKTDQHIYYVRTTLSMPNGELGRSSMWTNFWLSILGKVGSSHQALVVHRIQDPETSTSLNQLPAPEFLQRLNLESKPSQTPRTFQAIPEPTAAYALTPGLYRDSRTNLFHLVEFPEVEGQGPFLQEAQVREWSSANSASIVGTEKGENATKSSAVHLHTYLAILAGALSLFLYWVHLRREATAAVLIAFSFGISSLTQPALAQQPVDPEALIRQLEETGKIGPGSQVLFQQNSQRLPADILVPFRISWCSERNRNSIQEGYALFRNMLERRGTIHLAKNILFGQCYPGGSEIWWTDQVDDLDPDALKTHIASGGAFVLEAQKKPEIAEFPELMELQEEAIGLRWESPEKRGMLYRSFYLLQTFDGCVQDRTQMLTLRKKQTAKSPVGLIFSASFFSRKSDCFANDSDYRFRSFVNLMYTLLTSDYKEDQLQLPELLRRVRSLGLEP